jgi:hypothetical protein
MDKYYKNILTLLKTAFEKVVGVHPYQCEDEKYTRAYYLKELNDNFYKPMSNKSRSNYEQGSGNELKKNMYALRSSAALTYNLFGNGAAIFKDQKERDDQKEQFKRIREGVYSVEFEKQYPTLTSSDKPANLDAFLYQKDTCEAIAIEMKMLEWIIDSNQGKLSDSYLSKKNYIDDDAGEVFSYIAGKLKNEVKKIKKYDAFQIFKHTVACYRACFDKEAEPRIIKKLTLVNCMWTLPTSKIPEIKDKYCANKKEVQGEFETFYNYMREVKSLFKRIDKDFEFDIILCSFNDFLALLEKDKEELDYLRRYTFDGLNLTDK